MIADLLPLYQEARKGHEDVTVRRLESFMVQGHEVIWAEVTIAIHAHPRWFWGKAKDLPIRPTAYHLLVCECMLAAGDRSLLSMHHPACSARQKVVAGRRDKIRKELLQWYGGFERNTHAEPADQNGKLDRAIISLINRSVRGDMLDDGSANRMRFLIDADSIYAIIGKNRSDIEPALARLEKSGWLVLDGRRIYPPRGRARWQMWDGASPTDPRLRRQVIAYRRPVHDLRRANWKVVVYPWGGRWGYVVKRLHLPVSAPPLTIPTKIESDAINACLAELRPA